jgi:ubiquinone/menaquinone biosynthesis C-methylase UbiE
MRLKRCDMFLGSEEYYDDIYEAIGKDYAAEAEVVHRLVKKYKHPGGGILLDVACGTGSHTGVLRKYYSVQGLDYDKNMLVVARKKFPAIKFQHGNMVDFNLNRRFDVITCLFSSIGYVRTKTDLRKAVMNMQRHLSPGGLLLVEPWFAPAQWNPGHIHTVHVDKKDLKITRMSFGGKRGNISTLDFHYLIGDKTGLRHFTERHELGLFTHEEYMRAFQTGGMKTIHDKKGLDGRGLYIGVKT